MRRRIRTIVSSNHPFGVIESRSGANEPCSWIVALIVWCSEAAQSQDHQRLPRLIERHHFTLLASCSSCHVSRVNLFVKLHVKPPVPGTGACQRAHQLKVSEGHLGSLALESLADGLKVMKLIEKKVNNAGSTARLSPDQCQSISGQSERLRGSK